MNLKSLLISALLCTTMAVSAQVDNSFSGNVVTDEGAWCWFADPRAIHYKSSDGEIDAAYIGYIDVHGAIKASQIDFKSGEIQSDVLVRSRFQPDDHNNPTFLVLPDERIMIFYARHTDEPRFYYRVSTKKGDITSLGEEREIKVANNTTYPSPFILSDDPEHIYLCWRGINWHPTIAKLSLPDADDNVNIEWGPYQMVQSTGARPYAKYHSNGKDKIYVAYTTGHPDNENPNWLYFNTINLNAKKSSDGTVSTNPQLSDLNGNVLSTISDGAFRVSKTSDYKSKYPGTILDAPSNYRDWVWQIVVDENDCPIVAMVRISGDKNSHQYYYARWNGKNWKLTDLANGGGKFHPSNTEYCYSGGMALDESNINNVYLSIPTQSETTGTKVYEIWKYTVDDNGAVTNKEQVTRNSLKNNVRPFVLPGSGDSKLRLCWMHGDYYYWLVRTGYPLGYPTGIHTDYKLPQPDLLTTAPVVDKIWNKQISSDEKVDIDAKGGNKFTLMFKWKIDHDNYGGTLMKMGDLEYGLDASTMKPYVKIGDKKYWSQSLLGTSDAWATQSSGTDGKWYLTKLGEWNATFTYDGKTLTVYREGWIDQKIDIEGLKLKDVKVGGFEGTFISAKIYKDFLRQADIRGVIDSGLLEALILPTETYSDLILPTITSGKNLIWTSSNTDIISATGEIFYPKTETDVVMTVSSGNITKEFVVKVMPRDIDKNLLLDFAFDGTDSGYELKGKAKADGVLDLTSNTASGFTTNGYAVVKEGVLGGLRSYTFLLTVKADALNNSPRLYDFGSASGNSLFLRANPLSAGIKYNGGATTMVNSSTKLETGREYKLAVTYNAATKVTTIYIDGVEDVSGTANQNEAYMLARAALDIRNYIGRTQWWDSNYASDNVDFKGTIDDLKLYNTALTRKEICDLQGIEYEEKEYSSSLVNGDFEGQYSVMQSSGVSSDRAIYIPDGWKIDYSNPNNNDLTALTEGDLYYSNFFASRPKPMDGGEHSYWIRQNWGESTISLSQEVLLPEGEYTLSADMWKSGTGGNSFVYYQFGNNAKREITHDGNTEKWQKVECDFASDGVTPLTVGLYAVHTSNGSEKILGFDNIKISAISSFIKDVPCEKTMLTDVYAIDGRIVKKKVDLKNVAKDLPSGMYIVGRQKLLVK